MTAEAIVEVELDQCQRGLVLSALSEKRNRLLEEGKSSEFVSEVIVKVAQAPAKKKRDRFEAR